MMRAFTCNVRSLASFSPDLLAISSVGMASIIGWLVGNLNSALFTIVLFSMLIDLIAGSLSAVIDPLRSFDPRKLFGGLFGKFFRLLLIPTASLIDALYAMSPFPLSAVVEENFPVTILSMYALATAEIASTLNHFKSGGVDPGAIAVIMRHLDRIKIGQEPPDRRDYDQLAKAEATKKEIIDAPKDGLG